MTFEDTSVCDVIQELPLLEDYFRPQMWQSESHNWKLVLILDLTNFGCCVQADLSPEKYTNTDNNLYYMTTIYIMIKLATGKLLCVWQYAKMAKKVNSCKLFNALDNKVSPVDKSNILVNSEMISIIFLYPHFAAVPHWLHPNLSALSTKHISPSYPLTTWSQTHHIHSTVLSKTMPLQHCSFSVPKLRLYNCNPIQTWLD